MVNVLALELLESLYLQLQRKSDEGIHSGEVFEESACSVLDNLHSCRDPFNIYKQEISSLIKNRRRSNNPLAHVIRRLTEELFAIVTTSRYPIFLTPQLYVIYISLLAELSLGDLPPLFLETYDGHIESFENDFAPLLLEIYVRRSPLWVIIKNFRFSIENVNLGAINITRSNQLKREFQEFQELFGFELGDLNLTNFLPLFFTNSQSLKKGISKGKYTFFLEKNKKKAKIKSKKLIGSSASLSPLISPNSRIVSNEPIRILDNFALARMSLTTLIKIFDNFSVLGQDYIKLEPDFMSLLKTLESSLATFLAGSNIGNLPISDKVDFEMSQLIYELDGSASKDVFTLENKVDDYQPFHFLHIQVVSGLSTFLKGFNHLRNPDTNNKYFSVFFESVIAYLMRVFNQVIRIFEFEEFSSIQDSLYNYGFSSSKFSAYLEIIPSEMILIIEDLEKNCSYRRILRETILELYKSQINNRNISSLFLITFIEIIKCNDEIDPNFFMESWKYIFEDYLRPNLLNTYIIELFTFLISDSKVKNIFMQIDVASFLSRYLGILIRILVYHPDLSAKSIIIFILDCLRILKIQKLDLLWFRDLSNIILHIICMPLMTFFPQKVDYDKNDLKAIINYMKPNDKVLHYLSMLIYPDVNQDELIKIDIKSIICDLSSNLLLSSIYSHNNNNKIHTKIIFQHTLFFLDVILNELVDSIKFYRNSQDLSKISDFISEWFKTFPYMFHQGPIYSLEIQERFIKFIVSVMNIHIELFFDEKLFESILSCLKVEIYSNLVQTSPICWVIGELIMSQEKHFLNLNQGKILKLIESLKSMLEFCYLDCLDIYKEIETEKSVEFGSKMEIEERMSEFSVSSESSFLSDTSIFNGEEPLESNQTDGNNYCEFNLENEFLDSNSGDFDNTKFLEESSKYLESMYLVETIISTLCKIGISCKQFKTNIIKILEIFQRKIMDKFTEQEDEIYTQNELIQSSRLIVIEKINVCIKTLSYSSMFSSTMKCINCSDSQNNKSLNSIYNYC